MNPKPVSLGGRYVKYNKHDLQAMKQVVVAATYMLTACPNQPWNLKQLRPTHAFDSVVTQWQASPSKMKLSKQVAENRSDGSFLTLQGADEEGSHQSRDVQDVAQIEHLSHIPRLLEVAAAHCGQLFNATQIDAQISMNARTVEKYLGVLEKLFLVQRLPAWGRNELGRLVKTPKVHFLDAGL